MKPSRELAIFKEMAAELSDYLLSESLFWHMEAASDAPRLSLGMMLLTRARLEAARTSLSTGEQAEFERAGREAETALAKWEVTAERKAEKELHARLNLWQAYLADCGEDPGGCADSYAHEVTQRAIAALLLRRFPRLAGSAEAARLAALDSQIRLRLRAGAFVWPDWQQTVFSGDEFWFLYGRLG